MGGPEFFQTPMGRTFFDHNMPRLVAALEAIGVRRPTEVMLARYPEALVGCMRAGTQQLAPPEGDGWRFRQLIFEGGAPHVVWERPALPQHPK